jgi:hypothetical protein
VHSTVHFEMARPPRNPFELWIVCASTLVGALALLPLHIPRRSVVDDFLPASVATLWYMSLLLAGLVTLTGLLSPVRSLRGVTRVLGLERVGMTLFSGFFVGYGATLELVATTSPTGVLLLALGGASIARVFHIKREIADLTQCFIVMRKQLGDADDPPHDVD